MGRGRVGLLAAAVLIALLGALEGVERRPKLIVVLVIDQFRTEYIERFAGQWTGGLRRLIDEGAWFRRAAYTHLNTVTCAGHATIGTGAVPAVHGMVLNEWWDREVQGPVQCTHDENAAVLSLDGRRAVRHASTRLLAPTLADEMRRQLQPRPRVVSLSMKARSALMMAGQAGDVVLWFENGAWAYPAPPPDSPMPAVVRWLRAHAVDADRGRVWQRTLPRDRYLYPDDPTGKQPLDGWGLALPHPLGDDSGGEAFYTRWENSPFADDYLARLAAHSAAHLQLGQTGTTDLLAVSFSALDRIGHKMGPHSHEVQDTIVRLDRALGALLQQLDRQTGGSYVVGLSSDHGVSSVPEQLRAAGADAGRTRPSDVVRRVEDAVAGVLGPGRYVARMFYTDLYFQPGVFDRLRSNPAAMHAALEAASSAPGISRAYRGDELAAKRSAGDPVVRAAANSYYPSRSGDLILVPKPNWIISTAAATHGTANPYDTMVPVVLMGSGIKRGTYEGDASPADIAPTLASIAGVSMPKATGRVLREALESQTSRTRQTPSAGASRSQP